MMYLFFYSFIIFSLLLDLLSVMLSRIIDLADLNDSNWSNESNWFLKIIIKNEIKYLIINKKYNVIILHMTCVIV